jgi:acetoin utilization deacetylase AcuC-like enzyme
MSIPVFYTPKMVADSESASPSASKPAKVVASWQSKFDIEIIEPDPVTLADLDRAHDLAFVRGVLDRKIANGFGNRSAAVAAALPYTSGSMLSAARHAIKTKAAAAAPCSGFHHAMHRQAGGYCTFNGLMVTALALKSENLVRTVGILDLDMHYGNGTADIIKVCDASSWITHYTGGDEFFAPYQAERFLTKRLPEVLDRMTGCDLVLYQAGADPHVDDPHGGWLTTEQLRLRDAMVFAALAKARVPVAWNLAGDYQVERDGSIPKVLEIHDNAMRECVAVHACR